MLLVLFFADLSLFRITVLAGDTLPIEVYCHIPIMCEDRNLPYAYIPSKTVIKGWGNVKKGMNNQPFTPLEGGLQRVYALFNLSDLIWRYRIFFYLEHTWDFPKSRLYLLFPSDGLMHCFPPFYYFTWKYHNLIVLEAPPVQSWILPYTQFFHPSIFIGF